MSDVFCYLLGAGASSKSLPVVSNLPDRMDQFVERFRQFRENIEVQKPKSQSTLLNALRFEDHFLESLSYLSSESRKYSSIDTLAKKLHLTSDRQGLNRLKATLSTYLLLEQSASEKDYRYDSFLATTLTVIDNWIVLPTTIKIVSWNYDLQFEKAYGAYTTDIAVMFKNMTNRIERINGLAGSTPAGHFTPFMSAAIGRIDIDAICKILEMYSFHAENPDHHVDDIEFAWEKDPAIFARNIRSVVFDSTVLIAIGYSFPYFNRDIDKIVFANMPNLRHVYVQVLKADVPGVLTRIRALTKNNLSIQTVDDEDRFYIPFDL